MKSKPRDILIKIALALLGTAAALVLVEGLARAVAPAPAGVRYLPDPVLGYRHEPGQTTWVRDGQGEYSARFTTNSRGDPDRERALEKPAGVYRVAVIGDSMVEAAQVASEERFTYLLEQQLNSLVAGRPGDIQAVEVLNFGTAGYGTAQEWLYYREHARRFSPDLVVVMFLPGNDIKNNSYELEVVRSCRPEMAPFFSLAGGTLRLVNDGFYDKALKRFENAAETPREKLKELLSGLRLVELARQSFAAQRQGESGAGQLQQERCQTDTTLQLYDREVQQSSPDWAAAWQVTEAILAEFAADAAADGAAFHLVTATGPWEVQPETRDLVLDPDEEEGYDWEMPHRMTAAMADRLGIAHTSLLPAMKQAARAGTAVHYLYNGHYTPAGHRLAAEALLPVLEPYLRK